MKWQKKRRGAALLTALMCAAAGVLVLLCGGAPAQGAHSPRVIIDPGHGGFDPGTIGVSGAHEDDINLAVSLFLREELRKRGVDVMMTREDENAVSETKSEDMHRRREIISKSGAHCAIIIHMNSNPDASCSGPVSIYYNGSENGARLAREIQGQLILQLEPAKKREAYGESYFILKGGKTPSVIVEGGFMSNRDEEWLLRQESYQRRLAVAIADGVCSYLFGEEFPSAASRSTCAARKPRMASGKVSVIE